MARRNLLVQCSIGRKLTIVRGTTCEIRRIWHPRPTSLSVHHKQKRATPLAHQWSSKYLPFDIGPIVARGHGGFGQPYATNEPIGDIAVLTLVTRDEEPRPRWGGLGPRTGGTRGTSTPSLPASALPAAARRPSAPQAPDGPSEIPGLSICRPGAISHSDSSARRPASVILMLEIPSVRSPALTV
jgi:hypothetical protein